MAIRFLHLGQKVGEMAQMQAVSKPTICGWLKRWCAGGIEGMANQPKSGRSPKADEAYIALVEEVVEKSLPSWDMAIPSERLTACGLIWPK